MLLVVLPVAVVGQTKWTPEQIAACNSGKLEPITGKVLNDVTNAPIAGATVHYRGAGGYTINDVVSNPPSIQGEVLTNADGVYTLPVLPQGSYLVRAIASGYFGAGTYLQPTPVGCPVGESFRPTPRALCLKLTGKPTCSRRPFFDPDLRLTPDRVHLQSTSQAGPDTFGTPPFDGKEAIRRELGVFEMNDAGDRIDLLTTLRRYDPRHFETQSAQCEAWTWNLTTDTLTKAKSVLDQPCFPTTSGSISSTGWADGAWYLARQNPEGCIAQLAMCPIVHLYKIGDQFAGEIPPAELPASLKTRWTPAPIPKTKAHRILDEDPADFTDDHRFKVITQMAGGRSPCYTLRLETMATRTTRTIYTSCSLNADLVDGQNDRIFWLVGPSDSSGEDRHSAQLVEYAMKTGTRRVFLIPFFRDPELQRLKTLADGSTRIVYKMQGDCDAMTSDYTQPFQPEGFVGVTPNQLSLCVVTIPAEVHRVGGTLAKHP